MRYQLLSYSVWEKTFVYQNTFIYFFDYSMLSQQTMHIFLNYATAYVTEQIKIVYQCDFSVFQNCCYFFVLVFKSLNFKTVYKSKDSM